MSGVEIKQRALQKGRGAAGDGKQDGRPAPLYRASWSTAYLKLKLDSSNIYCG